MAPSRRTQTAGSGQYAAVPGLSIEDTESTERGLLTCLRWHIYRRWPANRPGGVCHGAVKKKRCMAQADPDRIQHRSGAGQDAADTAWTGPVRIPCAGNTGAIA